MLTRKVSTNQSDQSAETHVRWWKILEWGMVHPIHRQRRARLVHLGFVEGSDVGDERHGRAVFLTIFDVVQRDDQGRDLPVSVELKDDMTLQNVRRGELRMEDGDGERKYRIFHEFLY